MKLCVLSVVLKAPSTTGSDGASSAGKRLFGKAVKGALKSDYFHFRQFTIGGRDWQPCRTILVEEFRNAAATTTNILSSWGLTTSEETVERIATHSKESAAIYTIS